MLLLETTKVRKYKTIFEALKENILSTTWEKNVNNESEAGFRTSEDTVIIGQSVGPVD